MGFEFTKRTGVVVGIFTTATAAFFFLLLGYSLVLMFFKNRSEEAEGDLYKYKFLQYDISTNTSSYGILTFSESLDEGEFILREKGSSFTLISDFSSDEYICSGSCHCEDFERRSAAGALVSGGLITLVAAITAGIAFKQASEHFQTECEEVYSTTCKSESIVSGVDRCERVIVRKKKKKIQDEETGVEIEEAEEEPVREFECTGHCLPSDEILSEPGRKFAREFGCEKLKKTGQISVKESILKDKFGEEERAILERAFVFKHLAWFCPNQSFGDYWFFIKDLESSESGRLGSGVKKTDKACVGATFDHYVKIKRNRSVKCVPLGDVDPSLDHFVGQWDRI